MSCSLCNRTKEDMLSLFSTGGGNSCDGCSAISAANRLGVLFEKGEVVLIKHYHSKTEGRNFLIEAILLHDNCESGHMCFLVDVATSKPLKVMLDTNWLLKIK